MNNRDLTREQLQAVHTIAGRWLKFLGKMLRRMEKLGFSPTDELYRETTTAYDAIHRFRVTLHYLSCESGVGRPELKRPAPSKNKPDP
jgi:hypothetical protein